MKFSSLLCLALCAAFVLCGQPKLIAQQDGNGSASATELLNAFRNAHDRRDLDGTLKLFCWDRVTAETRTVAERHASESLEVDIQNITLTTEHPRGRINRFVKDGIAYGFNLPVVLEMIVETAGVNGAPERSYYPIGVKDGNHAIALLAPLGAGMANPVDSLENRTISVKPVTRVGRESSTAKVTIPSRTDLVVKLDQLVGMSLVGAGGAFTATFNKPVKVNGVTIIPAGARAAGIATKQKEYSPEMILKSIDVNGRTYRVTTSAITFNQSISFPPGTEMTFHLLFSLDIAPQ